MHRSKQRFIIQPIHVIDFVRRSPGNWSEFLHLFWQVAGLAFSFSVLHKQKEVDDWRKEKLDIVLANPAAVKYGTLRHYVKK